ncbi:helix-turn-helix domain-containing protein [Bdellovibrio bacteriovorus]|uniref:GlxA family transcriptional regulator n=1 Tax=Bdellovibrio bacteriovorus TaxID=959 RepID=UPI0021D22CE8|nr:helix-turn-helix domain-containing protein [Bdellovibrio bacteriovorus]UXR65927.1 helix-turn-helix domain-containing protein [Bdellovibrio bacteriovorus]
MIKIGLLAYPQCLPSGLLAGLDFFKAANLILGKQAFSAKIVGLKKAPVRCAHNQELSPEMAIDDFDPDVIVVPGFWTSSLKDAQKGLSLNEKLQQYLDTLPKNKVIWSYCAGVLFHARTGRLNRKSATATWWLMKGLEENFPNVQWDCNKVLSLAAKDLTAAGANGYFPIFEQAIKSVGNDRALAEVQKYLMTPVQMQKHDPFYELELASSANDKFVKIKSLIERTPASEVHTELVAEKLAISTKTLSRYFKKELNWTPSKFFRLVKFNQAAKLLTSTDLSLGEICEKLGFPDESNFRRGFKNAIDLTPAEYKQRFKRI